MQSDFVIQVTFMQEPPRVLVRAAGWFTAHVAPPKNPGINYLYMNWRNGTWLAVEIGLGS